MHFTRSFGPIVNGSTCSGLGVLPFELWTFKIIRSKREIGATVVCRNCVSDIQGRNRECDFQADDVPRTCLFLGSLSKDILQLWALILGLLR